MHKFILSAKLSFCITFGQILSSFKVPFSGIQTSFYIIFGSSAPPGLYIDLLDGAAHVNVLSIRAKYLTYNVPIVTEIPK